MGHSLHEATDDLARRSLTDLRDAVASRQVGAVEMVRAFLDRLEALDKHLNACNEVYAERALDRARAVDDGRLESAHGRRIVR